MMVGMKNNNRTDATINVHPVQWARPELIQGDVHAALGMACEMAAESGPLTTESIRIAALSAAAALDGIRGAGPAMWARSYRTVARALAVRS